MSCCFFSHLLLLLLPRSDRLSRRGTRHEVARRCEGWGGSSNFSLKVPPPPTDVWNLVAGYFWRWSPLYQSWAAAAVEPLASESERWVMLGEVEEQQRHQVASSEVAAPSVPLLSLRWTTVASSLSPVSKVMLICFSQPFGDCTWPASIPIPKNIVQVFWRITQDGAMNKWCHHDFGCLLNFQNGLHWYSALASVFAAPKSTLQQPLIQQIVHQWGLLPRRALKQIVNLWKRKKSTAGSERFSALLTRTDITDETFQWKTSTCRSSHRSTKGWLALRDERVISLWNWVDQPLASRGRLR